MMPEMSIPTDNKPYGDCQKCAKTYGTLGCVDMVNNEWHWFCEEGMREFENRYAPICSAEEIRAKPEENRTDDEKARLERAEKIPEAVRRVLTNIVEMNRKVVKQMEDEIMKRESENDEILDFLNGFQKEDAKWTN
jgi:hypothetical protein